MGHPQAILRLFMIFENKQNKFYHKLMWENARPVSNAGIQTHSLLNMSLFPLPLDQGILFNIKRISFSANLGYCNHYCLHNALIPLQSQNRAQSC